MEVLSEELLSAWLRLTSVIDNQRLVYGLSFNEAVVCSLLERAGRRGGFLTASALCARTGILKSQMNVILRSLEHKGLISRRQSDKDKRQIEVRLLPEGAASYAASHQQAIHLVDRLISSVGEEQIRQLIPLLHQVVDTFTSIQQEV